jgi:polyisoprenoid-binding protein YceI
VRGAAPKRGGKAVDLDRHGPLGGARDDKANNPSTPCADLHFPAYAINEQALSHPSLAAFRSPTMKRLLPFLSLGALGLGLLLPARAAVETYEIDPVHSSIGFTIRHFFTNVPGSFTKFSGTIVADRDHLENSTVEATIEVASVDTRTEKRDNHLRSPDFFDVAKFPAMTFKSKAWKKTGDDTFDVTGDLTIKGVTKEVVLKIKSLGFGPGMPGAMLSGWEASTTLNRNDFGITTFPKVLGDEVAVTIAVEADLQR